MESLQIRTETSFGATPLFSIRGVSQALSQHYSGLMPMLGVNGP